MSKKEKQLLYTAVGPLLIYSYLFKDAQRKQTAKWAMFKGLYHQPWYTNPHDACFQFQRIKGCIGGGVRSYSLPCKAVGPQIWFGKGCVVGSKPCTRTDITATFCLREQQTALNRCYPVSMSYFVQYFALWICKQFSYTGKHIMQLPPRENRDDLYAILNWFSKD